MLPLFPATQRRDILPYGVIAVDYLAVDCGSERDLSQVSLATDEISSPTAIRWRRRS